MCGTTSQPGFKRHPAVYESGEPRTGHGMSHTLGGLSGKPCPQRSGDRDTAVLIPVHGTQQAFDKC